MQSQRLIPTPLVANAPARRPIDIVTPAPPSRFRFLFILFAVFQAVFRSLLAQLWPRMKLQRYSPVQQAKLLRSFMEKMGGLWVKAGQLVALRRDLFSEGFCDEMARLQDRATGFPGAIARRIIERELGRPIDEVFSEFDETPIAAASIGQVHLARLRKSGLRVIIKVQRPDVAQSLRTDFGYIHRVVQLLTRLNIEPQLRWMDMYSELSNAILDELDYELEAASLARMRRTLRRHKIYVPKVFLKLSTSRILVMEKVEGVYISEFTQVLNSDPERAQSWLKENEICAPKVGKRLLFSHWRQVFEDNLYHCDLHPGNILLMRKNNITLIDFGSVGTTDKTLLSKSMQVFYAVVNQDYDKAADLFFLMAPSLPETDLSEVRAKIVRLYREFEPLTKIKTLPYHKKSFGRVAGSITQVMGEAKIPFPIDILRSMRADITLDAALMVLMPEINYPKVSQQFLEEMRKRQQKKMRSRKRITAYLAQASRTADMPGKLAENAYFEGEYLRRRALQYKGYLSRAAKAGGRVVRMLSRSIALCSLIPLAAYAHQRWDSLHGLRGTWVYGLFGRIPILDSYIWLLAALLGFYVSRELTGMTQIMEKAEPFRPGGERR